MKTKTKTIKKFDCVAFKQQSQERLIEEYEKRKTEFASYMDFIKAKVVEDEWSKHLWETIGGQQPKPLREKNE